jgi:prolyl 4-hydroxylase
MASSTLEHADRLLDSGERDAAISLVRSAAQRGDGDALFRLAVWHLVGDPLPRDLPAARSWLRRAVEAGQPDAALMEVALIANGTGGAPNWAEARTRLEQAAERWGGEARAQAELLARMGIDAQGVPCSLPEPVTLSRAPLVRQWKGLLTRDECAHIATSVLDLLAPSMVAHPQTGVPVAHPVRRSSAAVIGPTRETLPIQAIQRRVALATGTDVRQGEPLAVLHYAPGQEYLPHLDTLPHEPNQRTLTVLLYLNAGYAGGQTHFPTSGLSVTAGLGDAVAFSNVLPDGSPDPASRHAGLPVQKGVKWMATRWIRQSPIDVWSASN